MHLVNLIILLILTTFAPPQKNNFILFNTRDSSFCERYCGHFHLFLSHILEQKFLARSKTCSLPRRDKKLFFPSLSSAVSQNILKYPMRSQHYACSLLGSSLLHPNWPQLSLLIKPHMFVGIEGMWGADLLMFFSTCIKLFFHGISLFFSMFFSCLGLWNFFSIVNDIYL